MTRFEQLHQEFNQRVQKLRAATAETRGTAPAPCPDCGGTGWRMRKHEGTNRAERCECWLQATAGKLKAKAAIPRRYAKCSFANFTSYPNEGLERALRRSQEFASTFPAPQKGLLLGGPSGIGKTHLAVAILDECAEKGIGGLYCDAQALLNDIRASYDTEARTGAKEIIRRATTTDLLVLDDLGAEQLTDWGKDTIHRIVNSRYCEDRATICTTSLPTNPHDRDSLLFEIGGRALSILHQMCHIIEFSGADYRQAGQWPTEDTLREQWKARTRQHAAPAPKRHFSRPGALSP